MSSIRPPIPRFLLVVALSSLVAALPVEAFRPLPAARGQSLEISLDYEVLPATYERGWLQALPPLLQPPAAGRWTVERNRRTGTVHAAYGGELWVAGGIGDAGAAASAARDLLVQLPDLLRTREDNLVLRNVRHARGKYAVHFDQVVRGIPVYPAGAFVLLDESGRVVAFGSDFFPAGQVPASPVLSGEQAIDEAAESLGATPRPELGVESELLYVPALGEEFFELRLTWRVVFHALEPFGKWESFVDAATGKILGRRNHYHLLNVTGNVSGDVQDFSYCDGVSTLGMENLTVTIPGDSSDVTDDAGDFDIPHAGTDSVVVHAELEGPFANVDRHTGLGPDASFSGPAFPGIPLQIPWTDTNSRQDERDSFFHVNRTHDFVQAVDSTFVELDYSMPVTVGRDDQFCPGNAWWDDVGINLCEAGLVYANTGELGDVIYHEYGHGVTQGVYLRNGASEPPAALHEGNADILSNFLDRTSVLGVGIILGDCVTGLRDANNTLRYPDDLQGGSGHFDGQIIAGFHWDLWQELLATLPQATADSIALATWHFGRDLGTPQDMPSQVLWTFLADDDDATLQNGTPNYDAICTGATNHGFSCPEVTPILITHTELHHTEDGSQGFPIVATIVPLGTLDPDSLHVVYRVNHGTFFQVPMSSSGGPDEYQGTIPPLGQLSEVEYYIRAVDTDQNVKTSPPDAPEVLYDFDVAFLYDDLEVVDTCAVTASGADSCWTMGLAGDDATTGQWGWFDPVGTAAQPEKDATPAPGTMCFVTGQCSFAYGSCQPVCTTGCNDVDGGTTTLLSPVYDLQGASYGKIKYDRWYSNDQGNNPGTDFWVVDVSNDSGQTWTNVENTTVSSNAWTTVEVELNALFGSPGLVRLRFRASDPPPGAIVEAAVDEIRILAAFAGAVAAPEASPPVPLVLSLSQNRPNPFGPGTRIEYSIPEPSPVSLVIYDVRGRVVKRLTTGVRPAGRHAVVWDGLDSTGRRVAAGVYFYRLRAGAAALTRKMTFTP